MKIFLDLFPLQHHDLWANENVADSATVERPCTQAVVTSESAAAEARGKQPDGCQEQL